MSEDTLPSGEDYDAEIARLEAELEGAKRLLALLEDPEQRVARRARRQQLMGRWAEGLQLDEDELDALREVSDDEAWLFDPQVLAADGWKEDADEGWWFEEDAPGGFPSTS